MYSPKIREDLVPRIEDAAERAGVSTAEWVNRSVEARWDEAAGLSLDVVAYTAPQELHAVNAAERRGQPWTILSRRFL